MISPFETIDGFEAVQRMAGALSKSSMVPEAFRARPNDMGQAAANILVSFQLSARMDIDIFQVMQNIYFVHNKPAFSSSFIIALINKSGKFSPLRYSFTRGSSGAPLSCRAYAVDLKSGAKLEGPAISMEMAQKEGWSTKNAKWQSMPEQMLAYRAAAFWGRLYAPEVILGMHSCEELQDSEQKDLSSSAINELNAIAEDETSAPVIDTAQDINEAETPKKNPEETAKKRRKKSGAEDARAAGEP